MCSLTNSRIDSSAPSHSSFGSSRFSYCHLLRNSNRSWIDCRHPPQTPGIALMDIYDFQTERLSYNFDPDAVDAPDASSILKSPTMPPLDQHSPTLPPPIQHSPTPPVLRTPILSESILPSQGVTLQEPDQPTLHPHTGVAFFPVVFEEMFGKRKRGAECWKEFKFYKDKDGLLYAICVHCRGVAYRAESSFGTSNPTRHILNCEKFKKKSPSVDGNKSEDFDQI